MPFSPLPSGGSSRSFSRRLPTGQPSGSPSLPALSFSTHGLFEPDHYRNTVALGFLLWLTYSFLHG